MASEVNTFVDDEYMNCLYVLDSSYNVKMMLDTFTDLLWTERYCGYGEFEITIPFSQDVVNTCHIYDYVSIRESDVVMIIETIGITDSPDDGVIIRISGRSLDSLLEHRVILDKKVGTIDEYGNPSSISLQEAIRIILTNNLISPSESVRRIGNFSMKISTDASITSLYTDSFQERGSNLYEKVLNMCQEKNVGFRVNAISGGGMQFELYSGVDRSRSQSKLPAVVFSDSYENLKSSEYLMTEQESKNTIYIDWSWYWQYVFYPWIPGETSGDEIEYVKFSGSTVTVANKDTAKSGIARRETYMQDSDEYDLGIYRPGEEINMAGATNQIINKGKEDLSQYKSGTYFEGEVEPNRQFIYGRDYFLGDIVQLEGQYGLNTRCRIIEIMRSHSASEISMVPTFEIIE